MCSEHLDWNDSRKSWNDEHINWTISSKRKWKTTSNKCFPWYASSTNNWSGRFSSTQSFFYILLQNPVYTCVLWHDPIWCGGVTGGWTRVTYLDMTDNSTQCPSTLRQRIDSNKHTCAINSDSASCSPVIYSIDSIKYSKVCGKIKAYQVGSPEYSMGDYFYNFLFSLFSC